MSFSPDFDRCDQVSNALLDAAFSPSHMLGETPPRERVSRLLDRMAMVARTPACAARVLEVLARLARSSWVDGELGVVLRNYAPFTELDLLVYDGLTWTRLYEPLSFEVAFADFVESALRMGNDLSPLRIAHDEPTMMLHLVSTEAPPESESSLELHTGRASQTSPEPRDGPPEKPTTKIGVVKIPREAYRPDDDKADEPQPSDAPLGTTRRPTPGR